MLSRIYVCAIRINEERVCIQRSSPYLGHRDQVKWTNFGFASICLHCDGALGKLNLTQGKICKWENMNGSGKNIENSLHCTHPVISRRKLGQQACAEGNATHRGHHPELHLVAHLRELTTVLVCRHQLLRLAVEELTQGVH